MSKKKALITGCTGQDGSYLAELLLKKGATLDEKTQLKAEAKWGKGCCDLMLKEIQESKPLPKATDLLSSMTNQMDPKDVKQNTANDINGVMNKYTNSSNSQPTNNQQNIPTTTTFKKTKNQPGHWYKNPWIWTGIACGAGLAVWGAYAYLHKKPFVPALLTRTILQLKQRVMSRFSTARINPSPSIHFPNGETLGMSGAVRVSGL